ncbi:hypothetical protein L210DRAFT_3523906 [Boletus edulis BED1]|uniref:Uncharacterized protein n=1 Tax=Boletus edulis BED1 TaxID=1328754 RepID=A0AAD4C592_BOLED|nr:hypothetical protein L210DRAFT_3523906 [Boletus edulis BED1]
MDNPWATTWDNHDQDWPATRDKAWLQGDASWDTAHTQDASSDDLASGDSVSDHQSARSTSPPRDPSDTVSETTDASVGTVMSVASISDEENLDTVTAPEDDWAAPWGSIPTNPRETQPPDQWEAARQEKEKLNRAVPPELLDSLLRHCQQVSQEIWPTSENDNQDNWRSGFNDQADITALLAQLLPTDMTLPPTVQFSATATAKAMNEAIKLTRHLPVAASSPLSRLLASKGSLEWEKSIKAKQDVVSDTLHVGWRVLEKEDRLNTTEESKPRKAAGGLLSFWNRKASAIQAAPVETPSEQSSSPIRSSLECINPVPYPSQPASPSRASSPSVSPPTDSPTTVVATAPAASAVSRFLIRFSRTRGPQHTSLALSSDDLEFLSDVVPSASDPPDEDINDGPLSAHTGARNSSPLPPKLPPPISPPPKQPLSSSRPSSALGFRALNGVSGVGSAPTAFQTQSANHTLNVPVLAPPLSPRPAASFSHTKSPPLSLKDAATPIAASCLSSTPSIQQRSQPQPNSTSSILPPPQKTPPLLSIPPLLPPPPVSPPQTPRPSAFPSMTPGHSSTVDSYESDEEFSAFESFPPPASLPSSEPYPSQEPPSPPPRRTYERTHYPSSSSASSILSPASQTSLDQLCTAGSSISASLDGFDDFVSPPPVVRAEKHIPSPPPLPVKSQFQHPQPLRLDTFSRVYHAHTPSQKFASPTIHTSLLNSAFSLPSVSNAEHRRTQSLVDHAAACGGLVWPNSPNSDEPKVVAIPPPPSSSMSPKQLLGVDNFDLLGDGDTLGGGLETLPAPLNVVGGVGMGSMVSPSATDALRTPLGVGQGLGLRNQLQSPPMPSTSASMFSFSSLGTPVPLAATNPGSIQPTKPKQMGGLSAQDLSFFEGL